MSQQSVRKAAWLAASDTRRPRRQTIRLGIENRSVEVQDHHAVEGNAVIACPQVPGGDCETPFFLNDSDFTGDQPVADFAVPGVIRNRPAEELILRLDGRCIDHEQAN